MNYQNQGTSSSAPPVELPVKRKRGRPRKDEGLIQLDSDGGAVVNKRNKQTTTTTANIVTSGNMVGQMVTGVIEGSFDAGYLLNVKVGDSKTPLRGVVFVPGRYVPVTATNDVAPQTQMYDQNHDPNPNLSDSGEQLKEEINNRNNNNNNSPSSPTPGMFLVDDLQDKAPPPPHPESEQNVTGNGENVPEDSNFILSGSKERMLQAMGGNDDQMGVYGKSGCCFERKQLNAMAAKELMLGDDQRFMSSRVGGFGSDPYTTAMSSLSAIMFQPDSGLFDPKPGSDDPILRGMVEVHQHQVYASASSTAKDPITHSHL